MPHRYFIYQSVFRAPTPPKGTPFGGFGEFTDLILKPPVTPLPESTWQNFVFVPTPEVVITTGFGQQPDLIPRLVTPLPESNWQGFIPAQAAEITVTASFGQQPAIVQERFVIGGNIGFQFIPAVVVAFTDWDFASQSPEVFQRPRLPLELYSFVSAFRSTFQGAYAQAPTLFKQSRIPFEQYTFTALQIAYTPSALVFSAFPERIKLPQRAETDFTQFAILRIAYTPTDFDSFSQSPWQFAKPRLPGLDQYSFVSSFRAAFQGSYAQAPEQFKQPFRTDGSFTQFAILQIAYTPGPLTFSQAPTQFKPPRIFDTQGFVFVSTVAFTPTDWDCFSPPPTQFRSPRAFDSPGFVFVTTVAATPTDWDCFSHSPEVFRKPRFPFEQYMFTALQIAYTPSALVFTQSPTSDQFKAPRQPGFERYSFSFFQIAYTPGAFGFSQSPEQFAQPRKPGLDTYSFVSAFRATFQGAYLQPPTLFKQSRHPAPDRYDFAFLQIAYTPSAWGYSQAPEQFKSPTPNQNLNSGAPGFVFVPTVAATPTAFQFSQHPHALLKPRMPGLDQYSFTSPFIVAATPSAMGFSQAPWQFQLPIASSLLNTGILGWPFGEPPPFVPSVLPSTGHYPFGERPTRRNRGLLRSRAHPLFRAEIAANLGNRLELYANVLTLSQARIHLSGPLSVQLNASFDPRSFGNIRGFVRYDDDDEILQAITFLMTKQLDDK